MIKHAVVYCMNHPKFIVRNGRTYRLQPRGIYYRDQNRHGVTERLLHRVIWTDHNGDIPNGMRVHHKDHDPSNNDISNLELISQSEHNLMHARIRMSDPVNLELQRSIGKKSMKIMQEWMKTDKAKKIMSENAKSSWIGRQRHTAKCQICGREFLTFFPNKAKHCSKTCSNKYSRKTYRSGERHCIVCGKSFECCRYDLTLHCSRQCAVKTSARVRKGLQSPTGRIRRT